jgi:WD40 repeat protein
MRLYQVLVMWVGMAGLCASVNAEPVISFGVAKTVFKLEGHKDSIVSIDWSDDGKLIATASIDKTIRIWDAVTGKPFKTLQGFREPVLDVAFSGDGKRVIGGAADGTARVYDVPTGKMIAMYQMRSHVHAVTLNSDGTMAAAGCCSGGGMTVFEVKKEAKVASVDNILEVNYIEFAPDSKQIAFMTLEQADNGEKASIYTLDLPKGTAKSLYSSRAAEDLAYSPDGKSLLFCGNTTDGTPGGFIKLDIASGQLTVLQKGGGYYSRGRPYSKDRKSAVKTTGEMVSWHNLEDPKARPNFAKLALLWANAVAISPDGKRMAAGSGKPRRLGSTADFAETQPAQLSYVLVVEPGLSMDGPVMPAAIGQLRDVQIIPGTATAGIFPSPTPPRGNEVVELETGKVIGQWGRRPLGTPIVTHDKKVEISHSSNGLVAKEIATKTVRPLKVTPSSQRVFLQISDDDKTLYLGCDGKPSKAAQPKNAGPSAGAYQVDMANGTVLREFDVEKRIVRAMALDDSLHRLAVVTFPDEEGQAFSMTPEKDGPVYRLHILDTTTGTSVAKMDVGRSAGLAVIDHVVYTTDDGKLNRFDLAKGEVMKPLTLQPGVYEYITESADHSQMIAYGKSAAAVIDVKRGEPLKSYKYAESNRFLFAFAENRPFMIQIIQDTGWRFGWIDK